MSNVNKSLPAWIAGLATCELPIREYKHPHNLLAHAKQQGDEELLAAAEATVRMLEQLGDAYVNATREGRP